MGKFSIISKIKILDILAFFLVIVGTFGPWLWRGYNSYQVIDTQTGERELRYRIISKISPFYVLAKPEYQKSNLDWFVSPGTTMAGFLLVAAAITFPFITKQKSKSIFFLVAFLGYSMFFLSLGGGLWLGLITHFSWGFQITTIGLILMMSSIISKIFM